MDKVAHLCLRFEDGSIAGNINFVELCQQAPSVFLVCNYLQCHIPWRFTYFYCWMLHPCLLSQWPFSWILINYLVGPFPLGLWGICCSSNIFFIFIFYQAATAASILKQLLRITGHSCGQRHGPECGRQHSCHQSSSFFIAMPFAMWLSKEAECISGCLTPGLKLSFTLANRVLAYKTQEEAF